MNGGNKFSTFPNSVTHLFLVAAVFLTCIVLCSLFEFCCTLSSPLMTDIRIHDYELQSYNLEPIIIWRLFVKNLSPQQTSGWACCAGSSSSSTPHFGSPCSPFHDTFNQFIFFCLDFTCSSCSIWPSITAKRKIHLNLIIIEIHVIILQLSIKMFTNTFGKEVEGHLSVLLALCSQFSWYWTSNPQALVSSLGVILF